MEGFFFFLSKQGVENLVLSHFSRGGGTEVSVSFILSFWHHEGKGMKGIMKMYREKKER